MLCHFHPTLQQHSHQRCAIAILGLLHQQLSVIQDMSDGVAPLDDAVHDVASIILLVCAKRLDEEQGLMLTGAVSRLFSQEDVRRVDTNRLYVVVEGSHKVSSGDLQLLCPLHVHLHCRCCLRENTHTTPST